MKINGFILLLAAPILLASCATLKDNAKYVLADGKYQLQTGKEKSLCYVENNIDSINIYYLPSKAYTNLPVQSTVHILQTYKLVMPSLDIDILTALFKIRPQIANVLPTQLNANFNGNIYIGYRKDIYKIYYTKNALGNSQRQINHFGFSGGLFFGLSNTALTPSTTNSGIATDYDGMVLQKGVAGIFAVNKLTIGLSVGVNNLLDRNKAFWIYEQKPWFGLMLGLNLN
ncbi:MAG: hypothetical protein H7101_09180 [Deinococcales bacterium]|nr:hypothetical protein [Chitinophagaceae bacterium]